MATATEATGRTFKEMVERERDPDIPDDEFSGSSLIRRKLLQGEALTSRDAMDLTGMTNGLLNMVIKGMRQRGFNFDEEVMNKGGLVQYRCTNTAHRVAGPKSASAPRPSLVDRLLREPPEILDAALLTEGNESAEDDPDGEPTETRSERNARILNERQAWIEEQARKPAATNGNGHSNGDSEVGEMDDNGNGQAEAHANGNGHVPVPNFGAQLRVALIAEDGDGIRIGVKDDAGAVWLCRVAAFVPAEA